MIGNIPLVFFRRAYVNNIPYVITYASDLSVVIARKRQIAWIYFFYFHENVVNVTPLILVIKCCWIH